jgi:hypothetical protein
MLPIRLSPGSLFDFILRIAHRSAITYSSFAFSSSSTRLASLTICACWPA